MTDAELTFLERELAGGTEHYSAAVVRRLAEDSRRLRERLGALLHLLPEEPPYGLRDPRYAAWGTIIAHAREALS